MASTVKHLRSSTANKRPTASGLADGQLGINTASGTPGVFFKDSAGTVTKVGPAHVGSTAPNATPAGSAGNSLGELWVNNSTTINGLNYYTGSAFVNLTPSGTATVAGLVELATDAETQTGTDTVRAVTPSGLQSKVSNSISTTSSTTIASATAVKTAYDLANAALPKSGGRVTGELEIGPAGSLVFEGSTDDGFETTIAVVNPTADRTVTFPNVTGTVVTTGDTGSVTSTMILDGTIVNADVNASAAIVDTKLATIATAGKVSNSATTATNANTASAIVARDASGNFSAGTITAALTGNASTVTTNANLTGDVTSVGNATSIASGVIVNADVNASAAIDGTKVAPNFGSQTITTTGVISPALGTAALPSVAFTGDTNTGIYSPGADQVAISTNGSRKVLVDATGRLGLATDSPQRLLHVAGGVSDNCILATSIAGNAFIGFADVGTTDQTGLSVRLGCSSNSLVFQTGGTTERARIDSSGRLGLGTSSPATQLHIEGNPANITLRDTDAASNGYFQIGARGGAGDLAILDVDPNNVIANSVFAINVDNAERLRITAAGNVGIGTTSPAETLEVAGNAILDGSDANLKIKAGTTGTTGAVNFTFNTDSTVYGGLDLSYDNRATDGVRLFAAASNYPVTIQSHSGAHIAFRGGATERARIDSSGRLLVGTSSAVSVNGTTAGLELHAIATTNGASASIVRFNNDTSGPQLNLGKSRSGTLSPGTVVQSNDSLGEISFCADDGTDINSRAASITAEVDGTPGANDTPGRIVFSTTVDGSASTTEAMRITNDRVIAYNQPTPTSKSAAATLTITELKTGIIQYTGAVATLTLPTGTLMEGGFSGIYTNMAFEWSVINTGTGICTIGAGTAHTIVGSATVAIGASARFVSRRTASNTFVSYCLS